VELRTGDKISYPCQGPCLVGPVVKRVIDGEPAEFYHLTLLQHGGGELFIPLDKADLRGIRKLLDRSEIPAVLDRLGRASASTGSWHARTRNNLILFASGSALDLAEIVGSMTELGANRKLQPSDRKTLEKAKRLLVREIAEVTGETRSAVTETIDKVIARRSGNKRAAGKPALRYTPRIQDYADLP
jgi:RNA polymerase-interacting CarD/CdnL/TRCF family regulator